MDYKRFTGKEGQLVPASKAKKLTQEYQEKEKEILERGENFVKAEFFGIHTFNELIRMHGDNCVGFRIYYGIRNEAADGEEQEPRAGAKRPTSRLVLVPVDENGNDLTETAQLGGMKDMPVKKEVMLGGPLCPNQC